MDNKRKELLIFASEIRKDIIKMIGKAGSGHPGGSLSMTDILAVLFKEVMKHDPKNPSLKDRDRFILSKGHAAPGLYAVLARSGYMDTECLETFRECGSELQGHPDCRKCNGVEISTGSLGQGLSVAGGIALGLRINKINSRLFVMLGDGEIQEGQVWEAAMAIGHYKLNNVTAIVDNNNLQIDGTVEEVMNVYPIDKKFEDFGWDAININGHDIDQIESAFKKAATNKKPTVIVAKTIKGKGVSFMENKVEFHHAANMTKEKIAEALKSIDNSLLEVLK
jgi:transketolase